MKRFAVAILAFLYVSTSSGATIHLHFCMGKLADWGLGHSHSNTCSKCGMDKGEDNGCCKDVYKLVKVEQDQSTPESAIQLINILPQVAPFLYYDVISDYITSVIVKNLLSYALLRSCDVAVFVRNCVFLI